ncbi:aminotransferase class I/II-fold pyridoxal phosphate-dependent enzyme [Alkalihalobacillus trypoxylicola]|uniref:Lysine decarboxylase n=1 Tax=Alkalihalobacillus trypoxylicola TaxID=519424 RepID=A0A162EMQ7_9BACI|nr:aminotransferase class I/II-fold pyridoxal phosphate-dependent enzyme [Alkalihalobacillus trypoxylicola]KYG33274.1 hypothetical protein AZF04_17045 [Alkalihalobacillus trypoxylicola]
MKHLRTPIIEAIQYHKLKETLSFHVPGHKNGYIIPESLQELEKAFPYDMTEIDGLDDLHEPTGAIKEAERLLSDCYGTFQSFFLVGGSTVGNLAMIYSLFSPGEEVFVQRNSHKSIFNAIQLARLKPILLAPEHDVQTGHAIGISEATLKKAIQNYPEAKGLLLTYPNYYGVSLPLAPLISIAKQAQLTVTVDEAHGAHLILDEPFPVSSIKLGADAVVQSAHKMLPALTMSAYLHVPKQLENHVRHKLKESLRMFQSSSPSYLMLASMDGARAFIDSINAQEKKALLEGVKQFKREINKIDQLEVVDYDKSRYHIDPLKVTIRSKTRLSGFELQKLFSQCKLETELADEGHVLLIFGLRMPEKRVYEQITVLKEVLSSYELKEHTSQYDDAIQIDISKLEIEHVHDYKMSDTPLEEVVGKIAGQAIIPYPPGIPLIFPGERWTERHFERLKKLKEVGTRFQGYSENQRSILTIDLEEE